MVARPSRARAKPRSLYDEQAEELRKKGVELQTQDDDEENEEQDDDRSATFVAEPTQKKARARTGAVAKPRTNAAPKQATALFKGLERARAPSPSRGRTPPRNRPRPSSRPSPLPNKVEKK